MTSSNVLFVKEQNTGNALVIRMFFLVILCGGFYFVDNGLFFIYALMPFLFIPILIRTILLPGCMYSGIKMIKQRRWSDAIPLLEQTTEYFTQKAWIDQYRFFLLISLSSRSFREISLCNHGYCLLQLSRVKESKEMYESVLAEYPSNAVAQTQLHNMNLIAQAAKELNQ